MYREPFRRRRVPSGGAVLEGEPISKRGRAFDGTVQRGKTRKGGSTGPGEGRDENASCDVEAKLWRPGSRPGVRAGRRLPVVCGDIGEGQRAAGLGHGGGRGAGGLACAAHTGARGRWLLS